MALWYHVGAFRCVQGVGRRQAHCPRCPGTDKGHGAQYPFYKDARDCLSSYHSTSDSMRSYDLPTPSSPYLTRLPLPSSYGEGLDFDAFSSHQTAGLSMSDDPDALFEQYINCDAYDSRTERSISEPVIKEDHLEWCVLNAELVRPGDHDILDLSAPPKARDETAPSQSPASRSGALLSHEDGGAAPDDQFVSLFWDLYPGRASDAPEIALDLLPPPSPVQSVQQALTTAATLGTQPTMTDLPLLSPKPSASGPAIRSRAQARSTRAYTPYSSSSSTPSTSRPSSRMSGSSRSSAATSFPTRKRQVTIEEYLAGMATLVGWQCPFCEYVQRRNRAPDFTRHHQSHCPEAVLLYGKRDPRKCCGVPLDQAAEYGVSPDSERTWEDGEWMVGGCQSIFSRHDALLRHLRLSSTTCVGYDIKMCHKTPKVSQPRKSSKPSRSRRRA